MKMAPMTRRPTPPKRMPRERSPRSRFLARLRDPHTAGRRRYGKAGAASLDNLVDLLETAAAGQLQEHGRQLLVVAAGERLQVTDRPARDDLPFQDDRNA